MTAPDAAATTPTPAATSAESLVPATTRQPAATPTPIAYAPLQPVSIEDAYDAWLHRAVCVRRDDRAWIAVTGKDRHTWLNGLCTNDISHLQAGDGAAAFACNVKGRILFDLCVAADRQSLWLDLDQRACTAALSHFDRYTIMEQVTQADASRNVCRLGLMGPAAAQVLASFGLTNAPAMADFQHARLHIGPASVLAFKSHFAGSVSFDLIIDAPADSQHAADAVALLLEAGQRVGMPVADAALVEVARIEAGRGAFGQEYTEDYIPNETAQDHRAIHWSKGCYLGQEITIRIRHQGAPGKLLRGLRLSSPPGDAGPTDTLPPLLSEVHQSGKLVGRVTSVAHSPRYGALALAYLRRGFYEQPAELQVVHAGRQWQAQSQPLPFAPQPD